jgi:glycosyltransferase involved in cell wall biosynthesis
MEKKFSQFGVYSRVHWTGKLSGRALHDAYAAMDVFVFASHSETQGMVIAEAMAAGNPVIALDASGVREVVNDRTNGRLLPEKASTESLARALVRAINKPAEINAWANNALRTAKRFDRSVTAGRALAFYQEIISEHGKRPSDNDWEITWTQWMDRVAIEGRMLGDKVAAAARAMLVDSANPATQLVGS